MLQFRTLRDSGVVHLSGHIGGRASDLRNKTFGSSHLLKGPGEPDAVVVEQTFDSLDTNYDDSLSRAEFIAGALRNNRASSDKLVDIFENIDKNSDGEISRTEFANAAKGTEKMRGLDPAFKLADADADGFLSQDEFFFIARQFYPIEWQSSGALIPLFQLLDTDLDGRLSRLEFLKQADGGPVLGKHHASAQARHTEQKTITKPPDVAGGGQTVVGPSSQPNEPQTKTSSQKQTDNPKDLQIPEWMRSPADDLREVAHDIAQETVKAMREVIRQELGSNPLSPAAKEALDAAKSAGLPKERAAAAAAEAAGRAAADEAGARDASPKEVGSVAASATFRAAEATGLTKAQAAMRSAEAASKVAADKALATSSNFETAAQVAANVAFDAELAAGMSYAQAAQEAAQAAGRVIASHPDRLEKDVRAAAKAAEQGVRELGPKEVADRAASAAVGSAAAEEALASGKGPKQAAAAAARAVFNFSVVHGLKVEEAVSQGTVAAAEAALQIAIASGKGTQEVVDTAVEIAEGTLADLGNSTKKKTREKTSPEIAMSDPKQSNLTAKQKLAVMAEGATSVAIESNQIKDAPPLAGQMSQPEVVKEIALVAQLAGRAAELAGMTPQEMAVVMGLEVAEALPKFDAHENPEQMAEDATMAAIEAAKTLGLTLQQLEAVTMHAAAGGAMAAGKIFFLNVQDISQLAVRSVLAASKTLAEEDAVESMVGT